MWGFVVGRHAAWMPRSMREPGPFFRSCRHDPVAFPSQTTRGDSGDEARVDDDLTPGRDRLDVDRHFQQKDLTELTRRTYDALGSQY
jgi:hypothetical protein